MADTLDLGYGASADNANPYAGANPFLQNVVDLTSRDLVKNFEQTALPSFNAAMVRSGSFGNSGLQELTERGQNMLQQNLADASSKIRFNDYTQQGNTWQADANRNEQQRQFDLGYGRTLYNDAFGQNQQQLQTGLGLVGMLGGLNAQDMALAQQQQDAPLNYWQQFMQGANAAGSGGGQSVTTQGTTSNPLGAALGGAQLGSAFNNYGRSQGWWGDSGYTGSMGSGTNYSGDLANLGSSNGWWGTA